LKKGLKRKAHRREKPLDGGSALVRTARDGSGGGAGEEEHLGKLVTVNSAAHAATRPRVRGEGTAAHDERDLLQCGNDVRMFLEVQVKTDGSRLRADPHQSIQRGNLEPLLNSIHALLGSEGVGEGGEKLLAVNLRDDARNVCDEAVSGVRARGPGGEAGCGGRGSNICINSILHLDHSRRGRARRRNLGVRCLESESGRGEGRLEQRGSGSGGGQRGENTNTRECNIITCNS